MFHLSHLHFHIEFDMDTNIEDSIGGYFFSFVFSCAQCLLKSPKFQI